MISASPASSRRAMSLVRSSFVVPVTALTILFAGLAAPSAFAGPPSSSAPTPPDLFVAYAPLISQGNTPGADTVESFNSQSLTSLGSAQVGATPVAEVTSPDGGTVYVLNASSDSITPVDTLTSPPSSENPIALPAGFVPSALALTPDGADAYVTAAPAISNSQTPVLWEIALGGSSPGTIARTILLPSQSSPAGLALTPSNTEALITDYSGGAVIPVNLGNGHVGTPIPVGITPGAGSGPIGIAVTPNGQDAFVADSLDQSVAEINLSNSHVATAVLETGFSPQQVALSHDGATAWVTEDNATAPANGGFVVPVATADLTVGSPYGVGNDPYGVGLSPDGSSVFVANETTSAAGIGSNEGSISVIPTSGSGPVQTIYTSVDPALVVVTPDEAPTAAFSVSTSQAGLATSFDASSSYSLIPGGLTYTWNFGDGSAPYTTAFASTQHVYPLAGTYQVTLAVTDASGTSTHVVYTGQYVANNGGPSAGATKTILIPSAAVNRVPTAYVADSQSNEVTPILADPLQASAQNVAGTPIPVGTHPDAIAITPDGSMAYVVNFGSDNVTPINTSTNTASAPGSWISVGSEPNAIAITPDGSTAYVTNSGDGTVSKITLSTRQVVATIHVGGSPSGIAISPDGTTAYVTNNNPGYENLIPIQLATNTVEPGVPAGTGPDAVAISPDGTVAYVVDRGSNIVHGAVTPILLSASPTAQTPIQVGNNPSAIVISPDGQYFYVTNTSDGTVSQVATSGLVTNTLSAGTDPAALAIIPSSDALYVANNVPGGVGPGPNNGVVSEFSVPAAAASATPIAVGTGPDAVAVTPDQAPLAVLHVSPAPAMSPTSFDALQSTYPSTPAASFTWSFGDGSASVITTVPTTTHTYTHGGNFLASVTIADTDGTSTTQVFTGQTVTLNGSPSALATQSVAIPYLLPTITSVTPTTGQAGAVTSLIVTGTNLFGLTSVNVGGTAVTGYSVNSAGTQISNVLTPADPAGTVDITVTNPAGSSAVTPADVFTFLPTTTPVTGAPSITSMTAHWGPVAGGTGVTITGTNFTGATSVSFGTTAATTFLVDPSGTQITVVDPPASAAGSVDVTVTTPTATSDVTTADIFTYLAPPAAPSVPVVTSVSPDHGPTSGLTSVTITGLNLSSVSAVMFGSYAAESFHSTSSTSLTAVSPAVATAQSVDITVVTSSGTSAVVPGDAFTFESGIASAGPVVTSVTPSVGPLGGGNTVVIAGSNFAGISPSGVTFGTMTATYSVNSAGTQITATAPFAGTSETVDVVVTNSLGSSVITPSDRYTYQPNSLFVPTLTNVSPNVGPEAGGTTVTLTGTNFTGATAVNFGATSVSSFTISGGGDTIVVQSPAALTSGTVSLTVVNSYGTSAVSVHSAFTYLPVSPPVSGPQVTSVDPVVGPTGGGTGVTVMGSGFSGATAVDFGGNVAGSFTVNAAGTEILVVSPAVASAVNLDVTVTVASATSPVTAADVFTYVAGPTVPNPSITSVTPNSGPLTGGTAVTIVGTNFTGAFAVDFGGVAGTNVVINPAGTQITVTTPASAYSGTDPVSVLTPSGQNFLGPQSQFTYLDVPSVYSAMAPVRALDTRVSGGSFGAMETRTLILAGSNGVPTSATGVLVNLTVTDETSSTYVSLFPASDPNPGLASLTARAGVTVAHLEEVPLGANGAISIFNQAGSSHIVIDVEGYFSAGTGAAGRIVTLPSAVLFDTSTHSGGGPVGQGVSRSIKVTGVAGVPSSNVAAVLFDLTSSLTTRGSFATVYPSGTSLPNASTLNWNPGASATNLVMAKVGTNGKINIFNKNGSANFSAIVRGYVTLSGAVVGATLNTGVLQTAVGGTLSFSGAGIRSLVVPTYAGVPANAVSVVLDVTVTGTSASSWLSAFPPGTTARPANVAWTAGHGASTLVVVKIGAGGLVCFANHAGNATVTVSVEGFNS